MYSQLDGNSCRFCDTYIAGHLAILIPSLFVCGGMGTQYVDHFWASKFAGKVKGRVIVLQHNSIMLFSQKHCSSVSVTTH